MSLYVSGREVVAFHQKSYPKRRPLRDIESRKASIPVPLSIDLTYQEFIDGAVRRETKRLTA